MQGISSNEFDEHCPNHKLINNYWCSTEKKLICEECFPEHPDHEIIPLDQIPKELITYKYKTILEEPPKNNPIPLEPKIKTVYIPVIKENIEDKKELINLKNQYINLKKNLNDMLNDELNKVGTVMKNNPYKSETPNTQRTIPSNYKVLVRPVYLNLNRTQDNIKSKTFNHEVIADKTFKLPSTNLKRIFRKKNSLNLYHRNYPEKQISEDAGNELNGPIRQTESNQNRYLYMKSDKNLNLLIMFDIVSYQGKKIDLQNSYNFPRDSAMVLVRGKLLIAGGKLINRSIISNSYLLDFIYQKTTKLSNMNLCKRNTSLMNLNEHSIYSIGGFNNEQNYLREVEFFLIDENKWINTNPLNLARQDISLCLFNNTIIYSIGGAIFKKEEWVYFSNIERLNLTSPKNSWENINLTSIGNWTGIVFCGCTQISEYEIMIFGGYDSEHKSDVFIFNVDKDTIKNYDLVSLRKESSFICRNSEILVNSKYIYAIGYPYLDIHRYSFREKIWRYLDSSKWVNKIS